MKKNACLEVQALSKSYHTLEKGQGLRGFVRPKRQSVKALDKVSFTLGPGLYGLLGPNGAGKSTLLNIITGNLEADKGAVLFGGKRTAKLGRAYRAQLGYMPQQQNLYDSFTGFRFLRYLCALKELPGDAMHPEIERVAAAVHLSGELDKRLGAYSGGMKQRILAAGAMIGDPALLVLDEPTAGLDPKERVRLRALMAGLAKERIVLVATHVVSDVESVADEVLLLQGGRLAGRGTPAELVRRHAPGGGLEDVYLALFGEDEAV